jgi:transglutaminase-like putative cysteine protease
MPIAILKPYVNDGLAFGRCGEFALCYNGLCLANGYETRLIVDDSKTTGNKTAGDHVWVEVKDDGNWIHVDPTEAHFNDPKMYVRDWKKEVNHVVAITKDDSGNMVTIDVTKEYQ